MLRGCLFSLALYAALAVAYFFWFDAVFPPPGSYIGAGVVGFMTLCGLGALINARTAWKTMSLVSSAQSNSPLEDGRLTALTGMIQPLGKPLTAPFSGAECVICEYDLASAARVAASEDQSNAGSDFAGFLMTPCVIRSRQGDVRLLGFPVLEGFEEERCASYAAGRNAKQFLKATQFEDRAGLKIASVLSVFGEVWADEDGLVDKNLRLSKIDPQSLFPAESGAELNQLAKLEAEAPEEVDEVDEDDLDDSEFEDGDLPDANFPLPRMAEKRVPPGEEVCAVGVYRANRRGLLPSPGSTQVNRLLRGSAAAIHDRSRGQLRRNLIGGIVFLAVLHAAIYGVMQLYLRSPEGQEHRRQTAGEKE
jgi:hypothetical protein